MFFVIALLLCKEPFMYVELWMAVEGDVRKCFQHVENMKRSFRKQVKG